MENSPGSEFGLPKDITPVRKTFLDTTYLTHEYIIPPDVKEKMEQVASTLTDRFPRFGFITIAGGLANGSNALRRLESTGKKKPASDLDFYFGGYDISLPGLQEMADRVQKGAKEIGLTTDAKLNGKRIDEYLNLNQIDEHIQKGDLNLLALPFQASFGKIEEAKKKVIEEVLKRSDKQEVWDEIAEWHIQSLSLHHGTWSRPFSNHILDKYYPEKIKRFQLADTPEQAMASLTV